MIAQTVVGFVEQAAEAHFTDGLNPARGCPMPAWGDQPEAVKAAHRRKARVVIEAVLKAAK